jgi:hypothetical protein
MWMKRGEVREGAGNKMAAASDDNEGGGGGGMPRKKFEINVRMYKCCSTSA